MGNIIADLRYCETEVLCGRSAGSSGIPEDPVATESTPTHGRVSFPSSSTIVVPSRPADRAERAGVPRTMLSAYERDRRQATLPTLMRLLKACLLYTSDAA